jgi:DNA ligase 1
VKRFAQLLEMLDWMTRRDEKVAAMLAYFRDVPDEDAAWALYLLHGGRPPRVAAGRSVAAWAMEAAKVPSWLFDECYGTTSDLAETISLIVPPADSYSDLPLHVWIEERLLPLARDDAGGLRAGVVAAWRELDGMERLVWNKLVSGTFRAPVARALVIETLARHCDVEPALLAPRLADGWRPTAVAYRALRDARFGEPIAAYPFLEPAALDRDLESLGDSRDWAVLWHGQGERAQLLRRDTAPQLWAAAGESIGERYPGIIAAATFLLPGTVLDGEVHWPRNADAQPAYVAHDALEDGGVDVRHEPWCRRRERLTRILEATRATVLQVAPVLPAATWDDVRRALSEARAQSRAGVLLWRRDAAAMAETPAYRWDAEPFTAHVVLLYAQPARGRRAALHSEFTVGVWHDDTLVPFARVHDGLSDAELRRLDAWIRRHTVTKFGPVRHVPPVHVFEIGFESLQRSTKHKSGLSASGVRIRRWVHDVAPDAADSLERMRALLQSE